MKRGLLELPARRSPSRRVARLVISLLAGVAVAIGLVPTPVVHAFVAETVLTAERSAAPSGDEASDGDTTDAAEESEDDERDERDEREERALHATVLPLHDWIPVRALTTLDVLHTHAPPESAFTARLERPPRAV